MTNNSRQQRFAALQAAEYIINNKSLFCYGTKGGLTESDSVLHIRQKLCKSEQNPQKAGYKGQISNFLVRDLLKINELAHYITLLSRHGA